ncbi:MAG: DUF6175 family protein [Mucilaginibacter sp.]
MKKPILFVLLLLAVATKTTCAQTPEASKNVNVVQPKIMVIPFVKEGQDIRTVLDADFNKRLAVAKVKNGFDMRGFTTKDFMATVKQATDAGILLTGVQSDIKSQLIEFSGADIFVEVDINLTNSGNAGSAMVLLSAYDAATASAYATATCDSRERYNTDAATLINVALSVPAPAIAGGAAVKDRLPCIEDFLNILQTKFTDIVNNGRPVKVDFSLTADIERNFESPVGSSQLSDVIDDWMAEHSFKNNYHLMGSTATRLFYDEVRIPLYDTNGRNYKLNKFGQQMAQFLQTKGITASRTVKNGGIYITITN